MSRRVDNRKPTLEFLPFELPPLPTSTLYSLPPIGVRTGFVESLSSYMARLSWAHRITPGQLFSEHFLPLTNELPRESRIGPPILTFGRYNSFFNGAAKPAKFATAALERLTLRTDLISLSLLRWRNTISGMSLSKKRRAWCAQCFSDWRQSSKVIFEPLLWTIKLVTVCAVHNLPLVERCPGCGRRSAPLERRFKLGHCAKCNEWLGRPSLLTPGIYSSTGRLQPDYVSQQVLSALEVSQVVADQMTIANRLEAILKDRGWSGVAAFTREKGIHEGSFFEIKYGHRGAPLKTLLRLCEALGADLKEVIGFHTSDEIHVRAR